jgi:hypothetical protein
MQQNQGEIQLSSWCVDLEENQGSTHSDGKGCKRDININSEIDELLLAEVKPVIKSNTQTKQVKQIVKQEAC